MLMTICLMGCIAALAHVLVERPDVREKVLACIVGGLCVAMMYANGVMLFSL